MSIALEKVHDGLYKIDNFFIYKEDKLWKEVVDSIHSIAKTAAGDKKLFAKLMRRRLLRIKHKDKLYYSIAVLKEMGEDYFSDMYDARIIAERLMEL